MPVFKPFKGIRPTPEYVDVFPTYSLDNFTQEEINKKAHLENSYIQMIKPAVVSKSKDVDRNLRKIRSNFEELLEEKKLIQDDSSYYLYEQTMPDKSTFRGLLGLVSVDDFWDGKIKKHESTITERRLKMAHYLEKVNLQAEPVLLTYHSNSKVELLMTHEQKNVPIMNYKDEKGVKHKIWKIDNRLKLQQFKEVLDPIDSFYIADGHHRIGSVAEYAKKQRDKYKRSHGTEHYNFVYSFIVSNQSIKINDYNRLLKDLNGLSEEQIMEKLKEDFQIHDKGTEPYFPSQKFHISMYLGGKFYSLHVKHDIREALKEGNDLDHYMVDKFIFEKIFGITNAKHTDKITYLKGTSDVQGIIEIKEKVDSGNYKIGFGIYPISFNDLLKISDREIKMPPKCTLIEPKLITALVMYDMK
ncbi:DUF1015 domain-containing protein [Chryseobacterium sp. SC28]|uniref:DUF1015 domain-containing protein n=1 Tax=Chryseobacterium sp. SC28 TaxID=2268028 RepID=UPI000F64E278|nr:DUF1015 domain-containing protein [Chryseobacterium sp. SC28]RRQ45968.1 DUF1015 domain-containing protein [Chryseobacterium sp. SC28]